MEGSGIYVMVFSARRTGYVATSAPYKKSVKSFNMRRAASWTGGSSAYVKSMTCAGRLKTIGHAKQKKKELNKKKPLKRGIVGIGVQDILIKG
ncbi:hypothetical protein EVAR_9511_1 [Eumeta japonica]|uniref:Uncharacterized protein n=1 Tax=Eumeta variegata TaxID=151549 RepID=A0A4C1U3P5_EUMVA|nr:hypothetical protein EVAR_9511_1 [Eumeta japonica]